MTASKDGDGNRAEGRADDAGALNRTFSLRSSLVKRLIRFTIQIRRPYIPSTFPLVVFSLFHDPPASRTLSFYLCVSADAQDRINVTTHAPRV